ncbi:MAG: hypothetical protein FD189_1078 [Elusimicrobia bacterium]|nr:MAG: hypothetical protein FD189_1078 [Elusimicrobiota bacterium]
MPDQEDRLRFSILAQPTARGNFVEYTLSGPGIASPRVFVNERLAEDMKHLCEEVFAAGQANKHPPKERRGAAHQQVGDAVLVRRRKSDGAVVERRHNPRPVPEEEA